MEDLKLRASDKTLYKVLDTIEARLDASECPSDVKTMILIAAEEIYVNIAHYAYGGDEGEAVVQMEVCQDPRYCRVVDLQWIDIGKPVLSGNYWSLRRGLAGNQPLRTRSRCSKISFIDQKDENATTPRSVDSTISEMSTERAHMMMPAIRNIHQERVPR